MKICAAMDFRWFCGCNVRHMQTYYKCAHAYTFQLKTNGSPVSTLAYTKKCPTLKTQFTHIYICIQRYNFPSKIIVSISIIFMSNLTSHIQVWRSVPKLFKWGKPLLDNKFRFIFFFFFRRIINKSARIETIMWLL